MYLVTDHLSAFHAAFMMLTEGLRECEIVCVTVKIEHWFIQTYHLKSSLALLVWKYV